MTEFEVQEILAALKLAYPREPIDGPRINLWAQQLADLEYVPTSEAISALIRTSRFFPSIAEVREKAADLQLQAPPPRTAYEQARASREARHALVQRARKMVGDDWHWRETPSRQLERAFDQAYIEVRDAAMRALMEGDVRDVMSIGQGARELESGA